MLDKPLKVGDYIFTPQGSLARVIKINKTTYTIARIGGLNDTIAFNGIKHSYWDDNVEWFYCDNPTAKALELAMKRGKTAQQLTQAKNEIEKLLGKAKNFLEQITDIESIEVEEAEK